MTRFAGFDSGSSVFFPAAEESIMGFAGLEVASGCPGLGGTDTVGEVMVGGVVRHHEVSACTYIYNAGR